MNGALSSRDLFLVYAGLYIRYMSVVPPFTWAKYFDPTLPTATIQPTTIRCGAVRSMQPKKYFQQSEYSPPVPASSSKLGCPSSSISGNYVILMLLNQLVKHTGFQGHPSLHYLWAATGATTFLSAVSYAFMKDTYKFSHKEYDHQFGKKLFAFILFILVNIGFTLTFPAKV